MLPYKTQPVLKERIWGGRRLLHYHKFFEGCRMGESWETPLGEQGIRVLVKLLDSDDVLSLQVHPDDAYAQKHEKQMNGKSEMWVILECSEDSFVIHGFAKPVHREELLMHIEKNTLESILNYVKVRKGDCIYIPAGTVHTLGKGIVAYEVQQPSDLTYRLYDWGRTDGNGKARELHVEKALEVMDFGASQPEIRNIFDMKPQKGLNLITCPYFCVTYYAYDAGARVEMQKARPLIWSLLEGSAAILFDEGIIHAVKGDTVVIPHDYGKSVHIDCQQDIKCIESIA